MRGEFICPKCSTLAVVDLTARGTSSCEAMVFCDCTGPVERLQLVNLFNNPRATVMRLVNIAETVDDDS